MTRLNADNLQLQVAGCPENDLAFESPLMVAENAAWRLAWEQPHFSAHAGLGLGQKLFIILLMAASAAWVAITPDTAVSAFAWVLALFFLSVLLFRVALLGAGLHAVWRPSRSPAPAASLSDDDLPIYTVLTPLYDEPHGVTQLVDALLRLDYPAHLLDIKLILEADDAETIAVIERMTLPPQFDILKVPPLAPRTKPKACNYALHFARGEFVVIYDAEDVPDSDQLRKAANIFAISSSRLAVLQARLNYYNPLENWLTRQFTLEYSMWFDWLLPGLQALGLPIPLGGTSNHFRTAVLRKIGGWDSYNVTEDADLGLRLTRRGYRCAVLDSTTLEEANCQHGNWLRQRSRWQKGYMMTWLVHMRAPITLWRQLGIRGFLGFQLFVGGTVALALAMPAALMLFILALCACGPGIPAALIELNQTLFAAGLGVHALSAALGAIGRKQYQLLADIALTPFYWGLTMLASLRAFAQLFHCPFYWEKTRHAISKVKPAALHRRPHALPLP